MFLTSQYSGFIGNGSICSEPPRHESGFLLLSQGIAVARVPLNGKGPGRPVAMSSVSSTKGNCETRIKYSFQLIYKFFSDGNWYR